MPSLMSTIGLSAAAFYAGANQVKSQVTSLGQSITSSLGGKLSGILSAAAVGNFTHEMLELGGKVMDISNKLGISTDAVQQWDYALKQNGSSVEAAIPFFQKLSQARQKALEGNEDAIADFQKLGISMEMLKSHRVEDIAKTIAQGFEAGDPQQLIAPLVNVGGKGAMAMAAAFRDGLADALGEASIIPQGDIEALDAAADAWGKLKQDATAMFAPFIADMLQFVNGAVDMVKILLGGFVGALQGTAEAIRGMSLTDVLTGKAALKLGKGMFEGAQEGFMALANEKLDRDDAAKSKRDRLKKGNSGTFNPDGIKDKDKDKDGEKSRERMAKLEEHEEKKREARNERVLKLKEQIAQKESEIGMIGLNSDEKRAALLLKRQALIDQMARVNDESDALGLDNEEEALGLQGKVSDIDKDLATQDEQDRKRAFGLAKRDGNGSQFGYSGTFDLAAGPEMAAMQAQIQSRDYLKEIRDKVVKNSAGGSSGDDSGLAFG